MGDISRTVTFVIDNSAAEQRAIHNEFPACSIALCAFHVICAFNNKCSRRLSFRSLLSTVFSPYDVSEFQFRCAK
ncbi:unnamed protein product [Trichobilharzia szidati]|nr:unnamed protein product [Trichobilharzia szidati]